MTPQNPDFANVVRASFAKQTFMQTLGAQLTQVQAGEVHIELPFRADLCQQHGYLHAGVITSIVDNACGYAALSLLPVAHEVLAVEFKVNFLAPATGEKFIAIGKIIKAGRTLSVANGEVSNGHKLIATMSATIIARAN